MPRQFSPHAIVVALMGVGLFGCAVDVAPSVRNDETAPSSTTALVVIHQAVGNGAARSEISARFVKTMEGAIDERVLQLAGADPIPEMGCAPIGAPSPSAGPTRAITFLDRGDLVASSGPSSIVLSPREVPDPVGLISGVVYFGRTLDDSLPTSEAIRVTSADGSVAIHADVPVPLSDLRVGGEEAVDGLFTLSSLASGAPSANGSDLSIDVTWHQGVPDDIAIFDFTANEGDAYRCAFGDIGHGTIVLPTSAYTAITARRFHHIARDVDHARSDVRIDSARSYRLSIR